jgi:hypothetical protein
MPDAYEDQLATDGLPVGGSSSTRYLLALITRQQHTIERLKRTIEQLEHRISALEAAALLPPPPNPPLAVRLGWTSAGRTQ